eukprot:9440386-Alexandrium_andersonii.AAC.1
MRPGATSCPGVPPGWWSRGTGSSWPLAGKPRRRTGPAARPRHGSRSGTRTGGSRIAASARPSFRALSGGFSCWSPWPCTVP